MNQTQTKSERPFPRYIVCEMSEMYGAEKIDSEDTQAKAEEWMLGYIEKEETQMAHRRPRLALYQKIEVRA